MSPGNGSTALIAGRKREQGAEDELYISLHAFDYFMICLMRHPLNERAFIPKNSSNYDYFNVITTLQSSGERGWYPGNPYLELLDGYIQEFIPSKYTNSRTPGGAAVKAKQFTDGTSELYVVNRGFLRLVCEFWIDQASIVKSNYHDLDLYKELFNATSDAAERNTIPDKIDKLQRFDKLKDAEKGKVLGSFYSPDHEKLPLLIPGDINRWNVPVLQCIYIVLLRVLTALNLDDDYDTSLFALFENSKALTSISPAKKDSDEALRNSVLTLEVLGPALYDMLRCIFSSANKHSSALFSLGVEIWLLYLQPWKAGRKSEKIDRAKWKLYIANNIHFYTTLFACYVRGISTVTFYTSDKSGSYYFEYFQRVTGLFSSELVQEVDALVAQYDRNLREKELVHFAMYRHHTLLYPDHLDEERAHPMAGRGWLQDRFIKIREYTPLKRYVETIYKNCRENSSPNPSSNKYINAASALIDSITYKLFQTHVFQPRVDRQETNAFNTRATKGPGASEYEAVLNRFRDSIYTQEGWDYRELRNIVHNQARVPGNHVDGMVDYAEYTNGKKKPTRGSIIKMRTLHGGDDDGAQDDEWEIAVDLVKKWGLSADFRYILAKKMHLMLFGTGLVALASAYVSPLLFDLLDLVLVGRFVVYYICPSYLGIHLVSHSKNPSGINYNIASANNYDRYYHEIVTANIFLVICIQMDLLQLKELLTIVLCLSLFLLYAVDALLTARLVTLDVIPPKYLIRLYCIPAFVLTRFCFRFDTLSMSAVWASFNQQRA